MAEHAGQKRAAVKFLNRGKKVSEHRAKGRETASDDLEDAHEVRRGTGHNIPMTSSMILHRRDAHDEGREEVHTKERRRCLQQEDRDRSHEGKSVKERVIQSVRWSEME